MKTQFFLKTTKWSIATVLILLLVTSCSKDDDNNQPIDPRLEFVGSYRISETEVQYFEGAYLESPVVVDIDPRLKFELDHSLNADEVLVDMEEYIEDLYRGYYMSHGIVLVSVDVDITEPVVAQITGNEFEINNAEFEVTLVAFGVEEAYIIDNDMTIEGDLSGNILRFDFEIELSNNTTEGRLEGDSEGERD